MNITELIMKADEYLSQGKQRLAFQAYMNVVDYYRRNKRNIKVNNGILTAYNNAVVIGLYLAGSKDDLIKIRNLALEFIRVAKKSDDSKMYAIACFHAGVAHNALEEYKKAVELLKEALEVFELLGDDEGVMLACKNIAEAYKGLGYIDRYEVYIGRAKALAKQCGDEGLKEVDRMFRTWRSVPWVLR